MLRVNLLADETFRSDLLETIRGILRGITESVIREMLKDDDLLKNKIEEVMKYLNLATYIETWLKTTKRWEDTTLYSTISKLVDPKIKDAILEYKNQLDGILSNAQKLLERAEKRGIDLQEERIRQIVAEELRKRLS